MHKVFTSLKQVLGEHTGSRPHLEYITVTTMPSERMGNIRSYALISKEMLTEMFLGFYQNLREMRCANKAGTG